MSNAKHTPGPWAVNPKRAQVDAFVGGNPLPVCQLLWPTLERSEAETEANARLIASAPELLEELNSLLPEVRRYAFNVLHDDNIPADLAAKLHDALIAKHDAALAIVAKATGAKP